MKPLHFFSQISSHNGIICLLQPLINVFYETFKTVGPTALFCGIGGIEQLKSKNMINGRSKQSKYLPKYDLTKPAIGRLWNQSGIEEYLAKN